MSGSIAGSQESTGSTADTSQTVGTDTTGTTITVGKIPHYKIQQNGFQLLPELPSHKFRYSVWHDLRQMTLQGTDLHAPRVREGPPEKDKEFYDIEEEGRPIHHSLHGTARQNHMVELERWEDAVAVNLSFQELQHAYQRTNFHRILDRLHSAANINIMNNKLTSLKQHRLPRCEFLNLNNNYIASFKDLPVLPAIRCMTLSNNNISTFSNMSNLSSSPLQELTLKGNPVSFTINYRQKVFQSIPNLRILDGIPKLPSDEEMQEEIEIDNKKTCSII